MQPVSSARPRLALTIGDPNGIGPEVLLKCLDDAALRPTFEPLVVGAAAVMEGYARALGFEHLRFEPVTHVPTRWTEMIPVLEVADYADLSVAIGQVTAAAGRLAMQAVTRAVDLCVEGQVAAMVTAPISKEAIREAGYREPGHTQFIARRVGAPAYTMMMVSEPRHLRVGLLTDHVPLKDVPASVTEAGVLEKLRLMDASLRQDFGVATPHIAVLGLNPHAGNGGVLGQEEQQVLQPALALARRQGFQVSGPFPADGFFAARGHLRHDAVLAMYHDQGLVPFKTLAFDSGVNFTAGLPLVRTSPDHGTAFDIAGKGIASHQSMRHAIRLALAIAQQRQAAAVS